MWASTVYATPSQITQVCSKSSSFCLSRRVYSDCIYIRLQISNMYMLENLGFLAAQYLILYWCKICFKAYVIFKPNCSLLSLNSVSTSVFLIIVGVFDCWLYNSVIYIDSSPFDSSMFNYICTLGKLLYSRQALNYKWTLSKAYFVICALTSDFSSVIYQTLIITFLY